MKITKEQSQFLDNFLAETCFEIWNAGCTHRMMAQRSDEGVMVCTADDPLHPVKEYKTVQPAINFLLKQDSE